MQFHFTKLIPIMFLALQSGNTAAEWYYENHEIFGTNVNLQLWSEDKELANTAMARSVEEMWRIHNQLSPYIETSELSVVNANAFPGPIDITEEFGALIDKSLFYSQISDGAFDISFASLGFEYDYRNQVQPADEQIDALRDSIDYTLIELSDNRSQIRFLSANMKIDLGGIAKGYAVDRVTDLLKTLGIRQATITAGGDSRVIGDKQGQPWMVGIRNPRSEETAIRVPLEDVAISTSGDYERFFIDEDTGERIHHILNPSTGKSADKVMSVSVIGPAGFDTDPLSTTLFVLGTERGMELIEQFDGFDAIFIDTQGKVHFTNGLMPPE